MTYAFPHIAARLFDTMLAVEPNRLKRILDAIGPRIVTGFSSDEDKGKTIRDHKTDALRTRMLGAVGGGTMVECNGMGEYLRADNGIAVIPVIGPLSQRFDWISALCGFATYEGIKEVFNCALEDRAVKAILFDYDSPGGEVVGCFDLARYMLSMRDVKPIWAVANGMACSAAYATAGSAERFHATSMSYVGSIGVVGIHVDYSQADKAAGIKYTAIHSGKHKVDGWSHAPLDPDVKAKWEADMNDARRMFAELVGSYGRLSSGEALATEAEVYRDDEAVKLKLIDGVQSFDDTFDELSELVGRRSTSGAFTASSERKKHGEGSMNKKTKAGDLAENEAPTDERVEDQNTNTDNGEGENEETTKKDAKANLPPAPDKKATSGEDEAKRVTAIIETCTIAGCADKAMSFISKGASVEDVRKSLLSDKAKKTDANTLNTSAPSAEATPSDNYGWNAVVDKLKANRDKHAMSTR